MSVRSFYHRKNYNMTPEEMADKEIKKLEDEIDRLTVELYHLSKHNTAIIIDNNEQRAQLREKDEEIEKLKREVIGMDGEIQLLNERLATAFTTIAELRSHPTDREVWVEVSVKDELPPLGEMVSLSTDNGKTFSYEISYRGWLPPESKYTHWLKKVKLSTLLQDREQAEPKTIVSDNEKWHPQYYPKSDREQPAPEGQSNEGACDKFYYKVYDMLLNVFIDVNNELLRISKSLNLDDCQKDELLERVCMVKDNHKNKWIRQLRHQLEADNKKNNQNK
jgi:hypothetical protein